MHALHDEAGGQPDVLQELGLRYTLLGLFADAERCHARAVALQSDAPGALYNHATSLIALGRLDEAEAALDRVIELAPGDGDAWYNRATRSEEHTSELQSLMRNSYAVFCLKKKQNI